MDSTRQRQIAEGAAVARHEVILLLRASRRANQHTFTRRLAESWLAEFPGDLGIALVNAEAQWANGRKDLATTELKRLLQLDPELLQGQIMLAHFAREANMPLATATFGNVAILSGALKDLGVLPDWALAVIDLQSKRSSLSESECASHLKSIAVLEPPSPLPGLLALYALRRSEDWPAASEWTETMAQRWPDCLAFQLALAEALLRNGDESAAVVRLHDIASRDVTGQTPARLWGLEHPYRKIWPQVLEAPIRLPIPAAVAATLGWNSLGPGSIKSKARRNRKAPAAPVALPKEEVIDIREELDRLAAALKQPHLTGADGRFPAYVLLTSRQALEEKYGAGNLKTIHAAMLRLVQANQRRGQMGSHLVYVDDSESASVFALAPVARRDPWEIKNFIRDLDAALRTNGERLGALLIIGGPEIIPFHLLPNPVDDEDHEVPSDNPYATLDDNYFVPAWPVGRVPTPREGTLRAMVSQIERIATAREIAGAQASQPWWKSLLRRLQRTGSEASLGVTAQVWQRASHAVFRTIGKHQALSVSPPLNADGKSSARLPPAALGYFNLHGLVDAPEWFGQRDPLEDSGTVDYPIALRPQDVQNSGRAPGIVFSEACYGAHILDKRVEEAIALKFLASGTQAFVGSTCISYGSISTPLIAADLVGKYFWTNLKEGQPAGEALRRAKIQLAREMDRRQGFLDGEDQKTLISFVLYGDPLARIGANTPAPKFTPREFNPVEVKTVCARQDKAAEPLPISEDVIRQVKSIVRDYLPSMSGAKLVCNQEHLDCSGHECPSQHLHAKSRLATNPHRRVITLTKRIQSGSSTHTRVARITLDEAGSLAKLAVSR
ncbi:MAG: hypothetical protein HYZ26_06955 [Chloroflexi bacterium]|nr:hypothetical protein [Chloroflexota bacterium]